jgi:hypothetical protein
MAESNKPQGPNLNIKISDEELKGRYANLVRISHTREEFILDFINAVPPQGVVTSRVVMSPGHLKRFIGALQGNLVHYEEKFGQVHVAQEPEGGSSVN